MPASNILAIDQGTTSTRAIVFDRDGQPLATRQRELPQIYPAPGWVEHDAETIWADTVGVCRGAIAEAGLRPDDIAAIGITNQRETTVVWDRETGRALYNAIVWQDRRTAEHCRALADAGHEAIIGAKTGLLIDPYFSATKLAWLLDHVPGARGRAERGELAFGTIDSYLLFRLTGGAVHATDATNASRTMLFDIRRNDWDEELLALLGVPRAMLPRVNDNAGFFGTCDDRLFGAAIPVCGIAGDQQAAVVGQACFQTGMIKSTYGTGCFALMNIGGSFVQSRNRLLTTIAYRLDGTTTYAIEGSIFVAGAAVQWLRDGLRIIGQASETEALAGTVQDTGGVYLVPAFTGLGAPYWDPDARGALIGLTRDSGIGHIARAALEAQGYQTRDLLEAMAADTGTRPRALRVDGGMVTNNWVCQFLADVNGVIVERPAITETTALGAAYLAAVGVGLYSSLEEVSERWRPERSFRPEMADDRRMHLYQGWKAAVARVASRQAG